MTTPAGRGDATQPDPAMIAQAAEAISGVIRRYHKDMDWEAFPQAARAAAAVIVAATTEAIATAIEAKADEPLGGISSGRRTEMFRAAQVARAFAADLSAGTTTGGHTRYESCVMGADGRCTRFSHDHAGATTGGDDE